MSFSTPILLITFNRPAYTLPVLQAILKQNPSRLYIFSDGPRAEHVDDLRSVGELRNVFDNACNEFPIRTFYSSTNLGCATGVKKAIDWAFSEEDRLIVLEDDCLPTDDFFTFCSTMLDLYSQHDNIMHISGTRWNEEFHDDHSHMFSSIGHIWGWATWKRSWQRYDFEMRDWKSNIGKIKKVLERPLFIQYWQELFDRIEKSTKKHTWDYQWQYTLFCQQGLAVVPNVNLISNIGLNGAHTNKEPQNSDRESIYFRETEKWSAANPPPKIIQNKLYDQYHMRHHFLKSGSRLSRFRKIFRYYLSEIARK
jgi:hypothetical protein